MVIGILVDVEVNAAQARSLAASRILKSGRSERVIRIATCLKGSRE